MSMRIQPAVPPFHPEVAEMIDRTMKGRPPLRLFTTLARDPRLCKKFFAGGLLDRGNLTLRQREIVIAGPLRAVALSTNGACMSLSFRSRPG